MAAMTKFNQFTTDLLNGVHNFNQFSGHQFALALTNTSPVVTQQVFGSITEIASGNGYTAGGANTFITASQSSGVAKVLFSNVSWTASGGSIGPFRYGVVYNTTPTSPLKPLVGWYDFGSALTLAAGDTFQVLFDSTNGTLTVT